MFILTGPSQNLNMSRLVVYSTHLTGTSVKNLVHYAQMTLADRFQMYDYGSDELNLAKYNYTNPPQYDLRRVTTPTALYWGMYAICKSIKIQFI